MLPCGDIRVVSFEPYGAGPWATLQLADVGADVIKIEDPASAGDKRGLTLDLRHQESRRVLL